MESYLCFALLQPTEKGSVTVAKSDQRGHDTVDVATTSDLTLAYRFRDLCETSTIQIE